MGVDPFSPVRTKVEDLRRLGRLHKQLTLQPVCLGKVWASAPRADLQAPWPKPASTLVAPSENGATKAGQRKCRGKIAFSPSYRLLISCIKCVIQFIRDFFGRQGV